MKEIQTEIEIAAPIMEVWRILTDLDAWKEWNPIVNQASGVADLGSRLGITMRGPEGQDANKYTATVTELTEPRSFRWRATMMTGFLMTNDKVFELEDMGSNTRLVHIETYSGILVPLFWGKMEKHVPAMLSSMNDALKMVAEKNSDQ